MPTPCQKCFTIPTLPAPPFDCMGSVTHIDDAVWTVARQPGSDGGGTVAFSGNNGAINLEAATNQGESWAFETTLCNPTDNAILIDLNIAAVYDFSGDPGNPGTAQTTIMVNAVPVLVATDSGNFSTQFSIGAQTINTIQGNTFLAANVTVINSTYDATVEFIQP